MKTVHRDHWIAVIEGRILFLLGWAVTAFMIIGPIDAMLHSGYDLEFLFVVGAADLLLVAGMVFFHVVWGHRILGKLIVYDDKIVYRCFFKKRELKITNQMFTKIIDYSSENYIKVNPYNVSYMICVFSEHPIVESTMKEVRKNRSLMWFPLSQKLCVRLTQVLPNHQKAKFVMQRTIKKKHK